MTSLPSFLCVCSIVCLFVCLFTCLFACLFVCLSVCLYVHSNLPSLMVPCSYQTTRLCYTNSTLLTVHRCLGRSSSSTVGWRMSAGNSRKSTALPSNSGKITCTTHCTRASMITCANPHYNYTLTPASNCPTETSFLQGTLLFHHTIPVLPSHVHTHTTHTLRLHPHTSLKHYCFYVLTQYFY